MTILAFPGSDTGPARLDRAAVFYQACLHAQGPLGLEDHAALVLDILAQELGISPGEAHQLLRHARDGSGVRSPGFSRGRLYATVSRHAHVDGSVHPEDRVILDRLADALGLGTSRALALDRQAALAA